MKAQIEFKKMWFSRNSKEFIFLYEIKESTYFAEWKEMTVIQLKDCYKVKDCFYWLKNNLYEVYAVLELDIPFDSIDWIFQRTPKKMGVDLYE